MVAGCQERRSRTEAIVTFCDQNIVAITKAATFKCRANRLLLPKGAGGKVLEKHVGMAMGIWGKHNMPQSPRREKPRSHWLPGEELKKLGQVQIPITSCN